MSRSASASATSACWVGRAFGGPPVGGRQASKKRQSSKENAGEWAKDARARGLLLSSMSAESQFAHRLVRPLGPDHFRTTGLLDPEVMMPEMRG
eukprot:4396938-Amphidinium_carterae.1